MAAKTLEFGVMRSQASALGRADRFKPARWLGSSADFIVDNLRFRRGSWKTVFWGATVWAPSISSFKTTQLSC